MRILIVLFLICLLFFPSLRPIYAIENPLAVPNNQYGIHIIDQNDIPKAEELVNTNGDWGYVTLVIRDDQMDKNYWQDVFNSLRRARLIPLVRIATHQTGNNWATPKEEDARKWAEFLHSLNWVTKNRYVILFNEPNRATEWGGKISPTEYAKVIRKFRDELKRLSDDFFVLPAGLDMSAGNTSTTRNGKRFYDQMVALDKDIFTIFDGFVSHPYPSQGIESYKDEISYLGKYYLRSDIPVFLTETGWRNTDNDVEQKLESAYKNAWSDPRIVAITPFVLNYTGKPFEDFSWIDRNNNPTKYFEFVKNQPKTKGQPVQVISGEITQNPIPANLISDSHYLFDLKIKNTGQNIWEQGDLRLNINTNLSDKGYTLSPSSKAEPFTESIIPIGLTTDNKEKILFEYEVYFKDKKIAEKVSTVIDILPPTSINAFVPLGLKAVHDGSDVDLYIYHENSLVKEIKNVNVNNNVLEIKELHDIVPGEYYRFVITKPRYLPRQAYKTLDKLNTQIAFSPMLPFDPNSDGKFSPSDLLAFLFNPIQTLKTISPL